MDNPISPRARGWIYVAGLTIAALAGVAAAILAVLGLDTWQPVVTAIAAASGGLTGILARAHLSTSEPGEIGELGDVELAEVEPIQDA